MGNKRNTIKPSGATGGRTHRINGYIQSQYLDVLDGSGTMHTNITKQSGLSIAETYSMDLVEIIPAGSQGRERPLCKVVDYGKFLFDQKKSQRGRSKTLEQKEIFLKPNIDDADLNVKAAKVKEFAEEGHEVKVVCKFRGREAYLGMQRGADLLQKIVDQIQAKLKNPIAISPESKSAWMIVAPSK
jgi:translation initiation factor IF-3